MNFAHTFRVGFPTVFIVATILGLLGCGGGGSGAQGAASTSTTGGGGGNYGTLAIVPTTQSGQIYVSETSVQLSLNYTGTSPITYIWAVSSANGFGKWGRLTTVSGAAFPVGPSGLSQAVYNAPASWLYFGYEDLVTVTGISSSGKAVVSASLRIPLASSGLLPSSVATGPVTSILDQPTYKPGSVVTATVLDTPGLNNTSIEINPPAGFTPSEVLVNGAVATLPYRLKYAATDAPFTLTVKMTIPSSNPGEFPVTEPETGETGPWFQGEGSGGTTSFTFSNPFFIQ